MRWKYKPNSEIARAVEETNQLNASTYRDPGRLREDYGTEREAVESAYSRRQVVELVQNGADAITEAALNGSTNGGRIEVIVTDDCLYCANQGAPLTLGRGNRLNIQYSYTSDKPPEAIGRFGLGFKSVLALTDHPYIVSDSCSISFSPELTRDRLSRIDQPEIHDAIAAGEYPLLRFAEVVDPESLNDGGRFSVLADLQWASTVVVLPLKTGDFTWLIDSLRPDEFRGEFMIFTRDVESITLRCPNAGFERVLLRSSDENGTIEVLDGDEKAKWKVTEWVHELSAEAHKAFSKSPPMVQIAWARPQVVDVQNGELWSFFPIREERTVVPGIVNSRWQMNIDRSSLVEGIMNEELLQDLGTNIAKMFPSLGTHDEPGLALDYLPVKSGHATDPFQYRVLRSAIWDGLESRPTVPDLDGEFQSPAEVRGWPDSIVRLRSKEIQDDWAQHSHVRTWVHPSAGTLIGAVERRQMRRLLILEDLDVSEGSVSDWLECLIEEHSRGERETPDDSRNALELAMKCANAFVEREEKQAIKDLATACIVLTEAGTFGSLGDARIHPNASDAVLRPHPDMQDLCMSLQALIGLKVDLGERDLIGAVQSSDWERAWQLIHEVDSHDALRVLTDSNLLKRLPLKLVSGDFALPKQCLRSGDIVSPQSDPDCCVDPYFHQDDQALLDALGATTEPQLEVFNGLASLLPESIQDYVAVKKDGFRAHYAKTLGGTGPQIGQLTYEPMGDRRKASLATHLSLVDKMSPESQSNFVAWAASNIAVLAKWKIIHTNSQRYASIPVTSPTVFILASKAHVVTSQGLTPVSLAFPVQYASFRDFLPVAVQLHDDFLDNLGEPERDAYVAKRTQSAISSAVLYANESESGTATEFLARVALSNASRPREVRDDLALTQNLQQLRQRRGEGRTTWLGAEQDIRTISELWGIETLGAAELILTGNDAEVAIDEYLPALHDFDTVTRESSALFVIEADEIRVASEVVDKHRTDSRIYVSKSLDFEGRIDCVLRLAFPDQSDEWYRSVSDQHFRRDQEELVESCRSSATDVARLEVLLAGELYDVAKQLKLPEPLASGSESDVAQALLTVYGTAILKEIHSYSRNLDYLAAPKRWAGGAREVNWVTHLGFSPFYAGTPAVDRPSYEESWGPSRIGDLHSFQEEIAHKIQTTIAEAGEALVDLPTGSGKTRIMIEGTIRQHIAEARPLRVLWIAERQELCEQAVVSWRQLWRAKGREGELLRIHRFWGGNRIPDLQNSTTKDTSWVIVASRQKLRSVVGDEKGSQTDFRKCTVLIVDEAHHAEAHSYRQIKYWRAAEPTPFAYLGLSATPFRSDESRTSQLAKLFGKSLIQGMAMGDDWKDRIRWLQSQEYLSDVELKDLDFCSEFGAVSLTDDETRALTSTESQNLNRGIDMVNERLSQDPARIRRVVQAILDLDKEWPVVVFAGSVSQAKVLAVELTRLGIASRPIWGELDVDARRNAIEDFRNGRVRVLTNYNVLHEGFDAPMTRAVVIARFVGSDIAFLQMLGRGMRGPKNQGTKSCTLVTTGERLASSFDRVGNLDIQRFEYLWNPR